MDQENGLDMRDRGLKGAKEDARARYIHLDPATFSDARPQKFVHSLKDHPLMTLDSLAELALRRPANRVRFYNADKVTAGESIEKVAEKHATQRSLADMVRDIENNRTYLFIMNVETDPIYAPFARELLEEVKIALRARGRKMVCGWSWVFISAPGTVTPYHRDHEQTCLCQLRGKKTLSVWRPDDSEVCSEDENEHFHAGWSLKKTVYDERFQSRAQTFVLEAGDALYMPFSAPHWVQNGPETSVSFSVTFATEDTISLEDTHKMNALLRRAGLRPKAPAGNENVRDLVKQRAWRVIDRARSVLRRDGSSGVSPY
jgi:Cupin-like domain